MTDHRTVLLVVHTGRDEASETARRVQKVLGNNGIALRVLSAEAVDRGKLHLAPDEMRLLGVDIDVVEPDDNAAVGCELVLVLGGDGTFLRGAELARNASVPVLGVNLGRIGFLAEAEAEALDRVLEHVIARDYGVEDRMTLDVSVRANDQIADQGWAINEASLEKGTHLGVLGVVLELDGRPVS
ncbi:MAG: NAD(+)/NADH kinase, partial [Mycobacteriaceae bacterium]|nr:NAD(+)/NADH kinase [Mycobacteriaceae bacterium]